MFRGFRDVNEIKVDETSKNYRKIKTNEPPKEIGELEAFWMEEFQKVRKEIGEDYDPDKRIIPREIGED